MASFLNFGENNTVTLFNFLQDALAKNNEFEIRFGKFYQNNSQNVSDKRNRMNFDSDVDLASFYNLKNMFEKVNFEKKITRTREFVYSINNNGRSANLKRIIDLETGVVTTMMKQNLRKYDVYDYDLRISVSYERCGVNIPDQEAYYLVRDKTRTSFMLPFGKLDLTVVEQRNRDDDTSITKYEVEMEITSCNMEGNDCTVIMHFLTLVLQNRQDNFFVISGNERRRVYYEYKTIMNNGYFVGAQPETLHKERISTLYKSEYSVTDKADGERYLLIINADGLVYFMDNNLMKILKTDIFCNNYRSVIIDGELVKYENKIYFLAFDLLAYNNKDIRGNQEYNLKRRLEVLDKIVNELSPSQFYHISVKKYYFGNVFSGAKCILDSVDEKFYENDGLIFTPVNEPYPVVKKWSNLLKWKPAEMNTIDFYAKRVSSNGDISVWQLYVQDQVETGNVSKKTTHAVLFDVERFSVNQVGLVTYETTFSDSLLDKTTGEPYKSDTVIEFRWDFTVSKFVPLRTRWDKTANPRKHGNYSKVALDIWNNINNPIEKEYLLKFYSAGARDCKDPYFERMRRFHNKIKEYLYNKYCKDTNNLLELCSGRGGDLHKWSFNSVKRVDGYDISEKSIEECKRRLGTIRNGNVLDYNFYKLDLTRDDAYEIIYKNNLSGKFNSVCCQFGVHYFFESERTFDNILKVLKTNLSTDGHFIVTFMDNTCLNELFGDKNSVSYEKDGEVVYTLERIVNKNSTFGNKLKITLNGNNILGEGSDEWIIDFDNFCKDMEKNGFECVETQLFKDLYNSDFVDLLECERNISFLNRYCVFKKIKDIQDTHLVNKILYDVNVKTEFDFDTIDLHQNDISVYKVNSLYNIVDVLNCMGYRYYKNDISNNTLDDVPDVIFPVIVTMFKKMNIDYNPVFVVDPLDFTNYNQSNDNVYFTYHKHVVEKKTETDEEESLEYNNWYIVMYNNNLIFTNKNFKTDHSIQQVSENNKEQQVSENDQENNEGQKHQSDFEIEQTVTENGLLSDYEKLKNDGVKITIKVLKEFLQRADLKISGKRDELQVRLEQYLGIV